MPAPTAEDVQEYLGYQDSAWSPAEIQSALAAEKGSQALVCAVPADGADWPADLAEALCRRVAHNLAVRRNPLGVETAESEFGATALRVGGSDAEVNRLEAPYRVIPVA